MRIFYQDSRRKYSSWVEWGQTTYFSCCDCGLTHDVQIRITKYFPKKKTVRVEVRMKKAVGRTKTQRKKLKYKKYKELSK